MAKVQEYFYKCGNSIPGYNESHCGFVISTYRYHSHYMSNHGASYREIGRFLRTLKQVLKTQKLRR